MDPFVLLSSIKKRDSTKHRRYNLYKETMAPKNRIAIDLVGKLPKSKRGNEYILTLFCPFSHWADAYPISSGKAEKVITCLKKHIAPHSIPAEVLSDRGQTLCRRPSTTFSQSLDAERHKHHHTS